MINQHGVVIIIAACPNEAEALSTARKLIDARFAACVQMNPIRSIYRWQGRVDEESEVRLLIKTTESRFEDVVNLFRSNTTYQCPEIMSYRVAQGTSEYMDWIVSETRGDG